jgi:hypothetical protein
MTLLNSLNLTRTRAGVHFTCPALLIFMNLLFQNWLVLPIIRKARRLFLLAFQHFLFLPFGHSWHEQVEDPKALICSENFEDEIS